MTDKEFHEFIKACITEGDAELCRFIAELLDMKITKMDDNLLRNLLLSTLISIDDQFE
jgi:hypothetical protein